jgi:hypothetical protein
MQKGVSYSQQLAVDDGDSPVVATVDQRMFLVDASAGDVQITFPVTDGYTWVVKTTADPGANTITLAGASGTIDGAASNTTALSGIYHEVTIVADGTNLHIR